MWSPILRYLSHPTSEHYYSTRTASIDLEGTASDNDAILAILWENTDTGVSGFCTGTENWHSDDIHLQAGQNHIAIYAYDRDANRASDSMNVTYTP
jgi:hypothetical protein